MLRIILVAISCAAFVQALQFTDCSADPSNTAVTMHAIDISPMPIVLPGEITFSLNATVNRQIDLLFIQTKLSKLTFGTIPVEIPCIGDTNIGSCDNIDACSIMGKILNGSSIISANLGQQIDKMIVAALGHSAQCPVSPEDIAVDNYKLQLDALPAALNLITDGDYLLKILIKEDPTSTDNVGCIEFKASLAVAQPLQPVG